MQAWHIWFILAVALAIAEIFVPGFVILCFSGGSLVAAVLAAMGLGLTWQILGFALGSFLAFVSARPFFQRLAERRSHAVPTNVDRLIGMAARVLEETDGEKGMVKVGGEEWSARSIDGKTHAPGSQVVVERVEGNKLLVRAS